MFRRYKSSSDIAIELLLEKENVTRVLRSFEVVPNDFPE